MKNYENRIRKINRKLQLQEGPQVVIVEEGEPCPAGGAGTVYIIDDIPEQEGAGGDS